MTAQTKPLTKSELTAAIADDCELTKKQVTAVFESLATNIATSLDGCGRFVLPGLLKIEKKQVPARPARFGVPNPFNPGELMDVKAKPATTKIKVRPLKALKAM